MWLYNINAFILTPHYMDNKPMSYYYSFQMEPVPEDGLLLPILDYAVPVAIQDSILTQHRMMTASVKEKVCNICIMR
jgi:hypothetical protein